MRAFTVHSARLPFLKVDSPPPTPCVPSVPRADLGRHAVAAMRDCGGRQLHGPAVRAGAPHDLVCPGPRSDPARAGRLPAGVLRLGGGHCLSLVRLLHPRGGRWHADSAVGVSQIGWDGALSSLLFYLTALAANACCNALC